MQGEGLKKLQSGQPISTRELLLLIAQLSWPAILAQISSVVMQYIDTAMVGQLGSNASAAIGVVATTSWLFGDLCIALTIGFNNAVLAEASMSYLCIGVTPPDASLGYMLSESQGMFVSAPWYALGTGLTLVWMIFGVGLIGEGLQRRNGGDV